MTHGNESIGNVHDFCIPKRFDVEGEVEVTFVRTVVALEEAGLDLGLFLFDFSDGFFGDFLGGVDDVSPAGSDGVPVYGIVVFLCFSGGVCFFGRERNDCGCG